MPNLGGKHLQSPSRGKRIFVWELFCLNPQAPPASAASSRLAVIKSETQIHQPFSPQHSQPDGRRKISFSGCGAEHLDTSRRYTTLGTNTHLIPSLYHCQFLHLHLSIKKIPAGSLTYTEEQRLGE